MTKIDQSTIKAAVTILKNGGLVGFPTETVYGVGADAANKIAVNKIFAAKKRPASHPLIVHIGEINQLENWADAIPAAAWQLAHTFWPGPLTLILKKQAHVLKEVTGGQETVGLRMPNHPITLQVLREFGGGMVGPSANQFTHVSPTNAKAVSDELAASIDCLLDGGDCAVGLESTILDLSGDETTVLRPGMITLEALTQVLGRNVVLRGTQPTVRAPGMHHKHYAPRTPTILLNTELISKLIPAPNTVIFLRSAILKIEGVTYQAMPKEAKAYAQVLYRTLRQYDNGQYSKIYIEDVPEDSEWQAIRDRLLKASATG